MSEAVEGLLLEEWAALSGSTLMLAAAGAELVEGGGALGRAAGYQRAELHGKLVARLRAIHQVPAYVDLAALVELLSAALTIFALRAAHRDGGADGGDALNDPSRLGWRRIEKMISAVSRSLLDSH